MDEASIRTWVNKTGLAGPSLEEWKKRLLEACQLPIWEKDMALALAEEYVDIDGGDSGNPDLVDSARQALWTMSVQVCRKDFPQSALDAGPAS